jgi:hypothetical protein
MEKTPPGSPQAEPILPPQSALLLTLTRALLTLRSVSRLPFELALALRYLRPKRTFVSVITLIAIIGVMLGVAVLMIVIAVMSGFDREWRDKILSANAHLKVVGVGGITADYQRLMPIIARHPHAGDASDPAVGHERESANQRAGPARH